MKTTLAIISLALALVSCQQETVSVQTNTPTTPVGTVMMMNPSSFDATGQTLLYQGTFAVSYTHLDVYKRQLLLRGPLHLDQIWQRNAGDAGIADQRHHVVAMAAEHEGRDVLDRNVELLGEEVAEAGAIEHAGHAADHVGLQARELLELSLIHI